MRKHLFGVTWLLLSVGAACSKSPGGGAPPAGANSVLERNNHPSRDGNFVRPLLAGSAARGLIPTTNFSATFTGAMWASPLYLENGPGGKGAFYVVTTGNDIFALDEDDGHVIWTKNIGSSPTANQPANPRCGNIHPLGILSTPVIDAGARKIYVAGAIGTTSITSHEVHALSVDDGTDMKTDGWPVNVTAMSAGGLAFSAASPYQNQRSALSLVGGTLYVAYGGHVGDCGAYHGWVVGIDTKDARKTGAWATTGAGEAIWAAGGMASDGTGVFAMTGNSTVGISTHADSEELIRVTGLGTVDKSTNQDFFVPTSWPAMDGSDYDLGSNSPVYVEVPGAGGAAKMTWVVAISKDGHLYLVNSKNMGGIGGQAVDFSVAASGMSIHTVPAAYTTAAGAHIVFSTDGGAACPPGGPSGKVVMSVLIPPGATPAPQVSWCAALGGAVTAPIVTTADGSAQAVVWYMNNGNLTAVDGDSGMTVFTSPDTCAGVRQWTSPIATTSSIVTGADGHLCKWSTVSIPG